MPENQERVSDEEGLTNRLGFLPKYPRFPNPISPEAPFGTERESALGKAAEMGDDDATTERLADPTGTQASSASAVPGVTCWSALFCITGYFVSMCV